MRVPPVRVPPVRVVVTGAAGFIGQELVRVLARQAEVTGIDRLPRQAPMHVTTITADLLDDHPAARSALGRADVVYHLAGCPDVRDARPDADMHRLRDNGLAMARVLAAVRPEARLVVTSSSSVYGGTSGGRACRESDPLDPRGGYAASKQLVEQLCDAYALAGGRVCVVRPFTVAGPGQRPGMALARWLAAAQQGAPLRVFGSLERSRDVTDVRDVVTALVDLAAVDVRGVVNVGTGTGRTLGELVAAVSRAVGVEVATDVVAAADVEVTHTLADTARLRELVGWVPHTDIDDLLARQLAAGSSAAWSSADTRPSAARKSAVSGRSSELLAGR